MKHPLHTIGVMSGTSLDGLDLAYCTFSWDGARWNYTLEKATTIPYSKDWKHRLSKATELSGLDLMLLDKDLGIYIGECVQTFQQNLPVVDFIACHGHTIFHQPSVGLTTQIGSGYHIAQKTNRKVVNDFRSLDVALGGQGAPLVPVGDKLLFGTYTYCLNLGGIANISFESQSQRNAFDIVPVNMLLNFLAGEKAKEFDRNGEMACNGQVDKELLSALQQLPYYQEKPPKTLGWEWFAQTVIPLLNNTNCCTEDKLRTAVEHIALQLAQVLSQKGKLLATGGGVKNRFLMQILQQKLPVGIELVIPEEKLIDFKEALIFAFLGVLKVQNMPNCLRSVTGASRDNCGGIIYLP